MRDVGEANLTSGDVISHLTVHVGPVNALMYSPRALCYPLVCCMQIFNNFRSEDFWDDRSITKKDESILDHELIVDVKVWGYGHRQTMLAFRPSVLYDCLHSLGGFILACLVLQPQHSSMSYTPKLSRFV